MPVIYLRERKMKYTIDKMRRNISKTSSEKTPLEQLASSEQTRMWKKILQWKGEKERNEVPVINYVRELRS